jgi:hypothetical protein
MPLRFSSLLCTRKRSYYGLIVYENIGVSAILVAVKVIVLLVISTLKEKLIYVDE